MWLCLWEWIVGRIGKSMRPSAEAPQQPEENVCEGSKESEENANE